MTQPTYYRRNTVLFRTAGEHVEFQRVDGQWRRSERYASAADLAGDERAVECTPAGRMPRKAIKAVTCGK